MERYEVWATTFDDRILEPTQILVGSFDRYFNASLFAKAFSEHFKATVQIVEYTKSKTMEVRP